MNGKLIEGGCEVQYRGPATVGDSRVRLHDHVGGIDEMLWEALEEAGWVGEVATVRMTVALLVGVAPAPAPSRGKRSEPVRPPGRRFFEGGWIDDQGVVWQQQVGPPNGRVGPGYRLLKSERHPTDLQFGENMLTIGAVRAGWLADGDSGDVVDVPDVRIAVSVARRNPRWEAFASGAVEPDAAPPTATAIVRGIDESGLLALALAAAERHGDPNPELIRYARGSRFDVTRATGSIVFSDAPSYIIVMKGNFRARRARPPLHPAATREDFFSYPVQVLVVDITTGKVTDSGSRSDLPDLTSLGEITTRSVDPAPTQP